jgi:hypothetical protein
VLVAFEKLRSHKEIYAPRSRTKPERCPPVVQGFGRW